MAATLSLSEAQTIQVLGDFLTEYLPASVDVVKGQINRVPEPVADDYVVMWPILRERLGTNEDSYVDALFTGSIAGNTLTITSVQAGALDVGSTIFGVDIAANTVITALGTGTGGVGTYTVNNPQTIGSELIAAGLIDMLQSTQVTIQIDVHGPNGADNAQIITTLMRDEVGVDQFASSGLDVTPLYAGDPRQTPYLNGEQQIEERWSVDAVLQCNPIVTTPQQFFDAVSVLLVDVDVVYPPT